MLFVEVLLLQPIDANTRRPLNTKTEFMDASSLPSRVKGVGNNHAPSNICVYAYTIADAVHILKNLRRLDVRFGASAPEIGSA